ncbi:MAG: lysozyme [Streptosporangiales bacterium]|nr:lysozyme [Streptosporangiales bacterium]
MSSLRNLRYPRDRGPFRSITLIAFLLGALVLSVAPANASPEDPIPHPERDYMGSTIPDRSGDSLTWKEVEEALPQAQQAGIDVSHWQGSINWSSVRGGGIVWAYMKATEGTSYTDPNFDSNYINSYNAGLIRGAYHFALPDRSSGAAQARFFVNNGGNWSGDGKTLPPALDIEYNPYGGSCYGLSDSQMVSWIRDFSNTVKSLSGRYPVIYTTLDWWSTCTGNNGGFGNSNALWIARWASSPGTLPSGWGFWTFWQYTSTGSVPGISGNVDRNVFNGALDRLQAFARCTEENPC